MRASAVLWIGLGVWVFGFLATRAHMLHSAYTRRISRVESEAWLRQQCSSHEFYHNMKHHSTVCDEAEDGVRQSAWLGAISDVVQGTYLCGYEPCEHVLDKGITWVLGRGLWFALGVGVLFVVAGTVFVPVSRAYQRHLSRNHPLYLHMDPYAENCAYFRPHEADSIRDVHRCL